MLVYERAFRQNQKPVIRYGPMLIRDRKRMVNLNYIYNSNDIEIVNMFRMRRASFAMLVKMFRNRGLLDVNIHTSVE